MNRLSKNNNKEWFNEHKEKYLAAHENIIAFSDSLLIEMQKHDKIETFSGKDSLMRIYRDTRFSKDKTPYKTYFGGRFKRATKKLRGGYYFQIGPGKSLAAGGFFSPSPQDLLRTRKDMDLNFRDWKKMLAHKSLLKTFKEIKGEKISTAPKGFSKGHPAIELLNHKQFILRERLVTRKCWIPIFLKN